MEYTTAEQYWIWLTSVPGLTPRKFKLLIEAAGSARAVWDQPALAKPVLDETTYAALISARNERAFYRAFAKLEKDGITAVPQGNERYPAPLLDLPDPPPTLYIRGDASLTDERIFSIVGTRRPSYDGRKAAREFTRALSENGVTVVSGLARGIDTCAHEACVESGGRTIAILGSGLNVIYPPENAALAKRILDAGGALVSEMQPDEGPSKWSFPARNRIIAGTAPGVLVVEGRANSGAMITAEFALDLGREIFAVPGSIYAPMSEGANLLIQGGASPALSPWDIMESMRWGARPGVKAGERNAENLGKEEQVLYEILKIEPLSFDDLSYRTGFSASDLNSHLTMLTIRGIIVKAPGNYYRVS